MRRSEATPSLTQTTRQMLCSKYPNCSNHIIDALMRGILSNFTNEQLSIYTSFDFRYKTQVRAIEDGFRDGLSPEQVRLYADTKYLGQQMEQIRLGLVNGLTCEQLALYADPVFSWEQMSRIRRDLENGFSIDEVKSYARPDFSVSQMNEANRLLIRSKRPQIVDPDAFLVNLETRFLKTQVKQIRLGALHGLTEEQLLIYAERRWEAPQMRQIRLGLENGLTKDQILFLCTPSLSAWRMEMVRVGFEKGLVQTQIGLIADSKWDNLQANSIQKALLAGLNEAQVMAYANHNLAGFPLGVVYYGLLNGYTADQLNFIVKKSPDNDTFFSFDFCLHSFSNSQRRLLLEILPPANEWLYAQSKDTNKQDIE